jgi:hypothetical protein
METIEVRQPFFWRVALPPFGATLALFVAWNLPGLIDQRNWIRLFLLAIPIFILGVGCVVSAFRFKLIVTEKYVEVRDIRTSRISFEDVIRMKLFPRCLELYSQATRVAVPGGIEQREGVIRAVVDRVKGVPNVKVEGYPDAIAKHWGSVN